MLKVETIQDKIKFVQSIKKPWKNIVIKLAITAIAIIGKITWRKYFIIGSLICPLRKNIRQTKANPLKITLIIKTETGPKPSFKNKNDNGRFENTNALSTS